MLSKYFQLVLNLAFNTISFDCISSPKVYFYV